MKALWILALLLSMPMVSAYSMEAKSNVKLGENFKFYIRGNGAYAVEIQIPEALDIISDPSNGARTGTLYKTFTSGETILILRPLEMGTYRITGQYTAGEGIRDFNPFRITVTLPLQSSGSGSITPICPICPEDTKWSNCENIRQIKIVYDCSETTGYKCAKSTKSRYCTLRVDEICESGWVCEDSDNLAYQSSDCSLSSVQECSEGCFEGGCIAKEGIIAEDLEIEIIPAESPKSGMDKLRDFFRMIIDFLKFWD